MGGFDRIIDSVTARVNEFFGTTVPAPRVAISKSPTLAIERKLMREGVSDIAEQQEFARQYSVAQLVFYATALPGELYVSQGTWDKLLAAPDRIKEAFAHQVGRDIIWRKRNAVWPYAQRIPRQLEEGLLYLMRSEQFPSSRKNDVERANGLHASRIADSRKAVLGMVGTTDRHDVTLAPDLCAEGMRFCKAVWCELGRDHLLELVVNPLKDKRAERFGEIRRWWYGKEGTFRPGPDGLYKVTPHQLALPDLYINPIVDKVIAEEWPDTDSFTERTTSK